MFSSRLKNMSATFLLILLVAIGSFDNPYFVLAQDDAGDIKGDISDVEKKLKAAQKKKDELEAELASINASLSATDRAITETKLKIQQTENIIAEKEAQIVLLEDQMDEEHDLLTELMRELYYEDEWPFPRIVLSESPLSDIVTQPDQLLTVQERIQKILHSLTSTKADTESQKQDLADAKQDHESLLKQKTVQKYTLAADQEETASDVEDQAKVVARLQRELTELQSDLAALTGKSYDAKDIEDAVSFASKKTDVPKGFLMGMLKMETNLGKNVGGCTYAEVESGAETNYKKGKLSKKSWQTFLSRRELFKQITKELGYDYKKKKVSCNPRGYTGTGGAMGVAQFMPDTWLAYQSSVESKTGHHPPDPWSLTDGVMAMATKLARTPGVTSGNRTAWKKATAAYLGTSYAPYINGVLYWADHYKELF